MSVDPAITDEYADIWLRENSDLPEGYFQQLQDCHLSLDLEEATYNIPFDVLDQNIAFMDEVLTDFPPWYTFRSLFASHERVVEMDDLKDQGYWDGDCEVLSRAGSFMGDGLSFIHLTLYLTAAVRAVTSAEGIRRPYGQSVGDDLFLLRISAVLAFEILNILHGVGAKFSKINAICKDALTFCESYVAQCSDSNLFEDITSFKESIFADLTFLDTIKGSALSGKSKVKSDGAKPFIGHASLVSKQIAWHPIDFVKHRAKTLLWCRNYNDAVKLSSNMASLPRSLGGIELIIGPQINEGSQFWQDNCKYYERILSLEEDREFAQWYLLLQGIYRANPKGHDWSNDLDIISQTVSGIQFHYLRSFDQYVPESQKDRPFAWKIRHLREQHGLISIRSLSELLARQEAFLKQWDGVKPPSFLTLYDKNAKRRANACWALIKSNLEPLVRLRPRSIKSMADAFSLRTEGMFVKTNDPALESAFQGMPTLIVDFTPDMFS
jgi:hypothetical protein